MRALPRLFADAPACVCLLGLGLSLAGIFLGVVRGQGAKQGTADDAASA